MALTLSEILAVEDRKPEPLPVPEWGGEVFIKTMSGIDRDAYENRLIKCMKKGELVENRGLKMALLRKTLCDEAGELLIASDKDAKAFEGKSSQVIQRLFEASQDANGLGEDSAEQAAKNLPADTSGSSG